jgi:hypothetical protein
MKRTTIFILSAVFIISSVSVSYSQSSTGNTGTENIKTDSTNQQGSGSSDTQTGSSTSTDPYGTLSRSSGTGTTTGNGTNNSAQMNNDSTGTNTGTNQTGNNAGNNTGSNTDNNTSTSTGTTSGSNTESTSGNTGTSGITGMNNTGMSSTGMSTTGAVKDLSELSENPSDDITNKFRPIAEERANELVSKLNLDQGKADDIREIIMDYLNDYWENRVTLDKKYDADDKRKYNEKLSEGRVDLIDDLEGELNDSQVTEFRSFKVDWWKSLDIALFDVQQNAATSSMVRDNNNTNQQQ